MVSRGDPEFPTAAAGPFDPRIYARFAMIQCTECEFCEVGPNGQRSFKCDPFTNIKEPECIAKWQLIRLDMLVASYQGMLKWYGKLGPIQDKLMKYMKKELEGMDESERWKSEEDEEDAEEL